MCWDAFESMGGKHLLGMLAIILQAVTPGAATDHGKPFTAETVLERTEAVIVAHYKPRLASPFQARIQCSGLIYPTVQSLGIGRIADMG